MYHSLQKCRKKAFWLSLFLATVLVPSLQAQNEYGIPSGIQEGNILHCFNWKISDVKASLPDIAEAGFGSVQLSPLQRESAVGDIWYDLYRPYDFRFIESGIGTKDDLKSLCAEADKYGIKVIVDVVANHVDGHGGGDHTLYHDPWWNSNDRLRWNGDVNYNDRYSITHNQMGGGSGYPDVNSEDSEVANRAKSYIEDLKDCGVKGIRWDAAKHIALPSEGCGFWKTVTSVEGLYHYGEVLDSPGGSNSDALMKEYTDYISVTDNGYGNGARNNGGVPTGNAGWAAGTLTADKVVYWGESHDTYANDNGESKYTDQAVIDRAYAIVACRDGATALYLSRSSATVSSQIKVGAKGSTHFTVKQVAEVNKFRNAMDGKAEYYTQDNGVASLTRKDGGAVIVSRNGGGSVSIANGGGYCPAGTYTDRVSGGTFTVTTSTISGNVGSSGIAVIYGDIIKEPSVTLSPNGGTFTTETLTITATLSNATSGWYKIGDKTQQSFTGTTTFTIGDGMSVGESVTVSWSATGEDGTKTGTATFTKADPSATVKVYYNNPDNWNSVSCYIYTPGTPVKENASWPGEAMTKDVATGLWYYEVSNGFISGSKVIFNDGNTSGGSQYPKDVPGQDCGLDLNGKSMICKDNSTWTAYDGSTIITPAGRTIYFKGGWSKTPYVYIYTEPDTEHAGKWPGTIMSKTSSDGWYSYVLPDEAGTSSLVIFNTGTDGTERYPADQQPGIALDFTGEEGWYLLSEHKWYTSNPDKTQSESPVVTATPASGTSFATEVTVNLSVTPSATIYYTTDGTAPSTDSDVYNNALTFTETTTLKTLAVTSDGTESSQTFTYTKTNDDKPSTPTVTGDNLITDYYKVNPNGQVGTNRTVSMSFSGQKSTTALSNWTAGDLIAQGVARDVCQAFNGLHERPIVDSYAIYAAYDNENLYLGVQFVYEVWDIGGEGKQPGESKPYNMDGHMCIAFDLDPDKSFDGYINGEGPIWNETQKGAKFANGVDAVWMGSTKPGVGTPGLFFPTPEGHASYDAEYCKGTGEIKYGYADGLLPSINEIWGLDFGSEPEDLTGNEGFKDLRSETDDDAHTFYEWKIPLSLLGITKEYIENYGIGVMYLDKYGSSPVGGTPYDPSYFDNVYEEYSQDPSSSKEKEDEDIITFAPARIGKLKGTTTGIGGAVTDKTNSKLKVYASGGRLYIEAERAQNVTISTVSGMTTVRKVNAGVNTIDGLKKGIYIVNNTKIVL